MNFFIVISISIGLAMDAFAVSMTNGATLKQLKFKKVLLIGFFFGFFQTLMTLLGWYAGASIKGYLMELDIWIAFVLLVFVGLKMIYDSFKKDNNSDKNSSLNIPTIMILAVATSLDALAVGLSLSFMKVEIIFPSIIIGLVTFIVSIAGVYIGKKIGDYLGNRVELFGGILLIIIGISVLL
ncbi:MAG TPA: manganese efflux pump MntP family protein [Victivallales bacterium]|nr:manganese efflux pump MntP family protein [Victivallales bacterium]